MGSLKCLVKGGRRFIGGRHGSIARLGGMRAEGVRRLLARQCAEKVELKTQQAMPVRGVRLQADHPRDAQA